VSPYLIVDDAERVIAFLADIFATTVMRRYDDDSGRIVHSEVKLDDSIVMIADSTKDWQAVRAVLHVYVADVDAVYRRALAAGARSLQEPAERDGDPDRRGGFEDPAGNSWFVATQK
jgi:uncharacterized glyoxalase superfamily protein PhnB